MVNFEIIWNLSIFYTYLVPSKYNSNFLYYRSNFFITEVIQENSRWEGIHSHFAHVYFFSHSYMAPIFSIFRLNNKKQKNRPASLTQKFKILKFSSWPQLILFLFLIHNKKRRHWLIVKEGLWWKKNDTKLSLRKITGGMVWSQQDIIIKNELNFVLFTISNRSISCCRKVMIFSQDSFTLSLYVKNVPTFFLLL